MLLSQPLRLGLRRHVSLHLTCDCTYIDHIGGEDEEERQLKQPLAYSGTISGDSRLLLLLLQATTARLPEL